MEEQFNKEAKQGWRSAADAARITDETAGSKDRKHTSGGLSVAVDSILEHSLAKKKGRLRRCKETKEELPKHG